MADERIEALHSIPSIRDGASRQDIVWYRPIELHEWERLWAKVDKSEKCWIWTAAVDGNGYPSMGFNKRVVTVPRLVARVCLGWFDPSFHIDHLCRTPRCVRPSHLEPVSQRINILRGVGASAVNAVKTHCPRGHPYAGKNIVTLQNGGRWCRTCKQEYERSYYRRSRHA